MEVIVLLRFPVIPIVLLSPSIPFLRVDVEVVELVQEVFALVDVRHLRILRHIIIGDLERRRFLEVILFQEWTSERAHLLLALLPLVLVEVRVVFFVFWNKMK